MSQELGLYKKQREFFPDPREHYPDGLVIISDQMNTDILFEAYSFGIFPWPYDESPVIWFSPDPRGVLDFKEMHISKSLKKFIKKTSFKVSFNTCFPKLIKCCAEAKRKEEGTWITDHMVNNYIKFHEAGYAHSCEVWDDKELVGGIYGVYVGGVFSGESMFFKKSNASKLALVKLVEKLKDNGLKWMDIQMVTDNLKDFGGKYISKKEFYKRIEESQSQATYLSFANQKR